MMQFRLNSIRCLSLFSLALFLGLFSGVDLARASKVSIPIKDKRFSKLPPSDLIYQGVNIDEIDALELQKRGFDISTLNPKTSHLWSDQKLSITNYDELNYPKNAKFNFTELKASPSEIFRAIVTNQKNKRFIITASLDNHTHILRATLLRLLGYELSVPKFYKKMSLKFSSLDEKKDFIEKVGEQTLTKRDRWYTKTDDEDNSLSLQIKGFILEPAELTNVNIHLPLMGRERQQDRRVFRALLDVYTLTDFPQNINAITWQSGRVFNNKLIYNHPYASEFKNVTIDDLKWVHRKIAKLTRAEIKAALIPSQYPKDIEALILEKILNRINKTSEYLGLKSEVITHKTDLLITKGNVIEGKLSFGGYSDYVIEFHKDDAKSPYRFGELFRLFRTQITYSTLAALLDKGLERLIPGESLADASLKIQEKITEYRQKNPGQDGMTPVRSYSAPTYGGKVFANRNIVFGQYLGSNAAIQLVDTVGAEVNLGVFTNITTAINSISPTLAANVSFGRTYTHVRAMPDLKAASKQSIKKIFVPGLLKSLGKVIQDEYSCSIPENVHVEEAQLNNQTIYYVRYDKKAEGGKPAAIAKRQELIDSGISASIILLVKIDRDLLCVDELSERKKKNLNEFMKQFANNETFIINDTIRLAARSNVPIPLATTGVSLSIGTDHSLALLRSIVIRKTAEGVEVSIQSQKNLKNSINEGLNYFIEILNNSNQWTRGKLYSKIYKIKLEDINEEEQDKALRALRPLFVKNNHDLMKESYPPFDLEHSVKNHLHTFKFLWFKTQKLKMNHHLEIVVPNRPGESYSEEQRTRKLYSTMIMNRKGNDYHTFLDRAVRSLTGWFSIGGGANDPGQSMMGNSVKRYYSTESELTENFPLAPMTRIEYIWTGWKKKTKKLEKIYSKIESMYSKFTDMDVIDRTIMHASPRLRSYDIKATILLYPEAFERFKEVLFDRKEIVVLNALIYLYGKENWDGYCQRAIEFFGEDGPQVYYGDRTYNCVPPSAQEILSLGKKQIPTNRIKRTKFINKFIRDLFENFQKSVVLELAGKENFFSSVRITGFRDKHHVGYLEYISDTIGQYNRSYGTGTFDSIATYLGLSPYELRAMSFTPGM